MGINPVRFIVAPMMRSDFFERISSGSPRAVTGRSARTSASPKVETNSTPFAIVLKKNGADAEY